MTASLAAAVVLVAANATAMTELEVGHGRERLSGDHPEWTATYAAVTRTSAERASAALTWRSLERFDRRDDELGVSARVPLGIRWGIGAEGSLGLAHAFIPAWSGALAVDHALGRGFAASAGMKLSRYETYAGVSSVGIGTLGLDRYWDAYRLGFTGYLATAGGAWSASGRIGCDLFYRELDRVGIAVAFGRELESVGGPAPIETLVSAAMLVGRHELGAGWGITYEVGVQRQGDLFTRAGGRLGLRRRF
jgi:YaiO family outer membrane protein